MPSRPALRRGARRAVVGAAGPTVGGLLIAVAAILGRPVQGPWQWTVTALVLVPAILVHWHSRAETHGFSGAETLADAVGVVAYALRALVAGAAATFGVSVASQTGAFAAAAQLAGMLSMVVVLRDRAE